MSRYDEVETTTLTVLGDDGTRREVRYFRRRFPPEPERAAVLARHLVLPGDRLDRVSSGYTGDPVGFWRIGDANAALDPDDLVGAQAVGTEIVIPMPGMTAP